MGEELTELCLECDLLLPISRKYETKRKKKMNQDRGEKKTKKRNGNNYKQIKEKVRYFVDC